jgi:hypothetical protein
MKLAHTNVLQYKFDRDVPDAFLSIKLLVPIAKCEISHK